MMTQETIVAAFDNAADAQAAARDVEAAGIPAASITQHGTDTFGSTATATTYETKKEPGFWAKLFGTDEDDYTPGTGMTHDHAVYDRTIAGGGSVLSIKIMDVERDADRILDILDRHSPVDIEERSATYATATPGYAATATDVPAGETENIQLAEESLVVGKRVVNRGTTRIRRYVVETPVSEDVSLHRETVSVERRPVSGATTLAPDAFTDRTVEMTEMNEEAVVGKTARVVEEIVVHKDSSDHVETVRDTVRREEVEIEKTDDLLASQPVTKPAAY
jgi:uncharacterized protein (TIGR02271 family)